MQINGPAEERSRSSRVQIGSVQSALQPHVYLVDIGRSGAHCIPAQPGVGCAWERRLHIQIGLRVVEHADATVCRQFDQPVSVVRRGGAHTVKEGRMYLFWVISIPSAGDGHGPQAKGIRGPCLRATDTGDGVDRQLVTKNTVPKFPNG